MNLFRPRLSPLSPLDTGGGGWGGVGLGGGSGGGGGCGGGVVMRGGWGGGGWGGVGMRASRRSHVNGTAQAEGQPNRRHAPHRQGRDWLGRSVCESTIRVFATHRCAGKTPPEAVLATSPRSGAGREEAEGGHVATGGQDACRFRSDRRPACRSSHEHLTADRASSFGMGVV